MGSVDTSIAMDSRDWRGLRERLPVHAPRVTVVVTVYNYERYLRQCLESIAAQVYRNVKCVIVDDCSTDGSVSTAEDFIASDASGHLFELVRHERNLGQMGAFKTGLAKAEGEFLVYVDADDILLPTFIERHLDVHLSGMPVAFTSSDQYQINEHGEIIAGQHPDLRARGELRRVAPHNVFGNAWVWATTSSMMFRRAVLELILPDVLEPFKRCADNYVCHFANMVGGSVLMPELLGCYRRHGANYFSTNRIVGGQLPTGDMRTHPAHVDVRRTIVRHLLEHSDRFLGVMGGGGYLGLLRRSMNFSEAFGFALHGRVEGLELGPLHRLAFARDAVISRLRWALRLFIPVRPKLTPPE